MLLDTIQTIMDGLKGVVESVLTRDLVFYIGIGFTLLMILFFFIKSAFSYECKLERSVNRLNEWLFKNQTITEGNLIEFNALIKDGKTPKILRKHWQQYMLYRDKLPSEYMSAYNCIDKPAKTSSFIANIKNFISIYKVTAFISFFFSLVVYSSRTESILTYLVLSLIAPSIILILGVVFTLILRAMQNYNLASLYQTFHIFNRYIDKASATIPKYVDFEILFTKKEIRNGIPILGEYLEKRARQEQEELEEAQRNAVSHEEYDFSASGVDGSLVLERAMKESETYLNAKQRTLAEIQQFESEISTLKKNYENTSKDYQRKLQASKENMERLRQQQEESTNRIEVNYIRKQQQDEVKKQEQLEHDQEDATNKFNTEINSLSEEIEKRRSDIEQKRIKVQEAMESEYQTFSTKLHKTISADIEKVSDDAIQKITLEKDQYAQAITYLKGEVDNKDALIEAKDKVIEELQNRINAMQGSSEQPSDSDGLEEYSFEEYVPEEKFENEEYNFDTDNYVEEVENSETFEEPQEYVEDAVQEATEEEPAFDFSTDDDELQEVAHEAQETLESEEPEGEVEQESAEDGHYDENGYYWFNDKTYYDANGLYHDLEGNVYDAEGNLKASGQEVETEQGATEETEGEEATFEELQEETYNEDETADEPEETNVTAEPEDDNETVEEQEEKPRRKAGRPRKEKTEEEKPKRSVGRPKKEKPNEPEAPKRSVGRPKKEKTQEEEKPKRSVGRPKKEVSEPTEEQPKRKAGRPKKETTEVAEPQTPKRKAGRPKKSEQNDDHLDILKQLGQSLIDATEKKSEPKRKAGKK